MIVIKDFGVIEMKKKFEDLSIEEKNELMKKVQERVGLSSVTEGELKEEYLKGETKTRYATIGALDNGRPNAEILSSGTNKEEELEVYHKLKKLKEHYDNKDLMKFDELKEWLE